MFQKNLPVDQRIFSGSKYKFLVLGRDEIKDFEVDFPYIIISVTDPETAEAEIFASGNLIDILRLKFYDIGKPAAFQDSTTKEFPITESQALEIKTFVEKHIENADLIVCQCEQGVSRSAAIAAALSRFLQETDEYFFQNYWLNRYVFDRLTKALQNECDV